MDYGREIKDICMCVQRQCNLWQKSRRCYLRNKVLHNKAAETVNYDISRNLLLHGDKVMSNVQYTENITENIEKALVKHT